jgi:hypothetical protein
MNAAVVHGFGKTPTIKGVSVLHSRPKGTTSGYIAVEVHGAKIQNGIDDGTSILGDQATKAIMHTDVYLEKRRKIAWQV